MNSQLNDVLRIYIIFIFLCGTSPSTHTLINYGAGLVLKIQTCAVTKIFEYKYAMCIHKFFCSTFAKFYVKKEHLVFHKFSSVF